MTNKENNIINIQNYFYFQNIITNFFSFTLKKKKEKRQRDKEPQLAGQALYGLLKKVRITRNANVTKETLITQPKKLSRIF